MFVVVVVVVVVVVQVETVTGANQNAVTGKEQTITMLADLEEISKTRSLNISSDKLWDRTDSVPEIADTSDLDSNFCCSLHPRQPSFLKLREHTPGNNVWIETGGTTAAPALTSVTLYIQLSCSRVASAWASDSW